MLNNLGKILSAIGRPLYFVITRILLGLILFSTKLKKKEKKKRRAKKISKIVYKGLTFPKINLPKLHLPKPKFLKISPKIRLEELRVFLFELKIFLKIKNFISKIIGLVKKPKFKFKAAIAVPVLIFISIAFVFYFFILKSLPSPRDLEKREQNISTKIYDRNGKLLYKIYKDQNRTIIPLSQIPPNMRLATLAAEDAEFYSHPGFSVKGIFRALQKDLKTGSIQGGSTITQQLVKNTLLTPEKTIVRKIRELILSIEVESTYTKDEILEMYLNEVSFGGTAYGIEEASQAYFGKNVGRLTLAEAAFLAGLPKSPTAYSPFGSNPDLAISRQKEVLHLMVINKFISLEEENTALNERLVFRPNRKAIKAPHFVMYIRQLLVAKYGEEMVEKGGLEVTTSLDLDIQELSENVVQTEVEKLKNLSVGNGAAIIVNPKTGEILGMVGSKNYFDIAHDGNVNVTTSLRQPGSSIKVVNYAYALSGGYTPASIIDDSPIIYSVPGSKPYSPVNYDGQFKGLIPLRSALAQSRNIPAVKILASYGVAKMVEQGKKMGITTWNDPKNYGLSLTLGGGAVTMTDLAKVYSTIANYGKRPDLLPILEIKDYKGRILEKNEPNTTDVMDGRVAFILTDILKDNNARALEFGTNSYLAIPDHPEAAVKTGTSNDLRDNWTAGYNQDFLVITWVGNNNNSPMSKIASGVTGASPIWNKIMSAILENSPSIDWKAPDGVSKINICVLTGTLPCDGCPTRQEWFLDSDKPKKYCDPKQIQKIISPKQNTEGKILENAASTGF